MRRNHPRLSAGARCALIGAGVLGALAARWLALPFESGDYVHYLSGWWDFLVANGGFAALRHEFANYNPPYLYLLAAGSYLDPWVRDLTVIKAIAFVFDSLLAFFIFLVVRLRYPPPSLIPAGAALAVLCAPWVFLNGAVWGQADSTYTAFLVGSLYFLLVGRRAWAFLFFGLAFSFKLQAIFFAPLLLWLLLKGEARWREALPVPLVFALSLLPAAWIGRPWSELFSIYAAQTAVSRALTNSGPALYHWIPGSFNEWAPLFVGAAAIAMLLITDFLLRSDRAIGERLTLLAAFAALLLPWILPHIRERDFYPAETLSLVLAFFYPRYWFLPVGLGLITTIGYLHYLLWTMDPSPVPEHWLALGVLSLIVVLGRDVYRDFAALPRGRPAAVSPFAAPRALVWSSMVVVVTASAAYGGHRMLRHRAVEERIEAAGAPVVSSPWRVYWEDAGGERNLLYFREGCYTKTHGFVLHFYPEDVERLAPTRRPYGFSVLEFDFEERELMWGRNCLASVPLPDYPLNSVVTGQTRRRDDHSPEFLWLAGFRPPGAGTTASREPPPPRFEGRIDPERYGTPFRALASGEWGPPVAESGFDLYLQGRELRYHREPCARADLRERFFLHIYLPSSDAEPAPEPLNRDFDFYDYGVIEDGRCLALVHLPEGRYTKLDTGQWEGPNPWRAEGRLDRERYRAALRSLEQGEPGEPDVRSAFDLYFGEDEIRYYRESCSATDLEGRFALTFHPPPASGDEPLNRDFDFYAHGVIEEGSCLAIVPLPEGVYGRLETGQWGERPWQVTRRLDRDRYRAALRSLDRGEWGEPDVREFFDLYWRENELRYVRRPCAVDDTEARFYLHFYEAGAPAAENRDFDFAEYGVILDDACLALVPQRSGDFRRISTGQFAGGSPRIWQADLRPGRRRMESLLETIAAGRRGPPAAHSTFDLYLIDSALVFHRAPCSAGDAEARFFLHFYPEDAADLPAGRRNSGFENRDFDFRHYGDFFAEACLARVPLPDYPISRIRTGQFRPGDEPSWSAEVRPGSSEPSP